MAPSPQVVDNATESRLEIAVGGETAFAQYRLEPGTIVFIHTFVPESLRGQGLATRLVEAGLQTARDHHRKVLPLCATFAAYMQRHPETDDLLAENGSAPVGS